jgi:uncharacterized membrane protein HdeD (DUF308 family)
MQRIKSKYWWVFSIRGNLAILFGCAALLLWPILELGSMAVFFGAYIFIQGVLTLIAFVKIDKSYHSLPVLLESVWGIFIGIFLVMQADVTLAVFMIYFVSWGFGAGLCKAIGSVLLYRKQRHFWILEINGLVSMGFYLALYFQAQVTKEPIIWILAIYFVVYGSLMIFFGVKLKAPQN